MMTDTKAIPTPAAALWRAEFTALMILGWPLIVAQLARNALFTTDLILTRWLGAEFLAAASLATSFYNPILLLGVGIVGAVAPLVAQALGRRDIREMRRVVRQGLWVAIALGLLIMPVLWQVRPLMVLLGQDPGVITLAEGFIHACAWLIFPAMGLIVLQSFLAAHGDTRIILWITLFGVLFNAGLNWVLMFGNLGFPRLELVGAGITTAVVNLLMFALTLGYILRHPRYRRYHLLGRFWRADWQRFFSVFRLGLPIGLTLLAEVGLFASAAFLMGRLGTDELAAHAVALQWASLAFMIPLGLGQATTVRVGNAHGRGDREGVTRAGWAALVVGLGFSAVTSLAFFVVPHALVSAFLDPSDPTNAVPLALAATYLLVAALFQFVDGAQAIAAAILRGLSDTKIPMLVAIFGYWGIGFSTSWLFGFVFGWRGLGVWLGLAAGLAVVAVILAARFAMRDRLRPTGA